LLLAFSGGSHPPPIKERRKKALVAGKWGDKDLLE
jgi:hypothetical protein